MTDPIPRQTPTSASRAAAWVFAVALALGLFIRLVPLIDFSTRLFQHYPTEDGYLTLTVARNIALGKGFTVSAGTVPTNGSQPLVTLVYSLGFYLAGGDRTGGVLGAWLYQAVVSLTAAWLIRKLTREVLPQSESREWVATVAASFWLLNPLLVGHTMNCLETGTVAVVGLLVYRTWIQWLRRGGSGLAQAAVIGVLMGLLAWTRVDTVFLMCALALAHLHFGLREGRGLASVRQVSVMAAIAGAVISPWLIYGKWAFGYWVPVSGIAEARGAHWGQNLVLLPATLFEYVNPVVAVPHSLTARWAPNLFFLGVLAAWIVLVLRALRHSESVQRALIAAGLIHTGLLAGYYGIAFGAGHFISRFLMPASPLIFIFSSLCILLACRRLHRGMVALAAVGAVSLLVAQHVRQYLRAVPHPHWQAVEWVRANVPNDVWIGAVQSGTVGFFHDRTLNLDGKVDPAALAALLREEQHQHIVDSPAQVLVDWVGLVDLHRDGDKIAAHFDITVEDPVRNLCVLKRRGSTFERH